MARPSLPWAAVAAKPARDRPERSNGRMKTNRQRFKRHGRSRPRAARIDAAPAVKPLHDTVDNIRRNERGVPLGPWYLVWDNIANPALMAEGAGNWPYQVKEIGLVTLSNAALLPAGLDIRFHEGAELVRTHCLACHKVNGYGGEKFEGDLAEILKEYPEGDFLRLVLTPASARSGATMSALSDRLPDTERRRIAGVVFDYLRAIPVRP